MEEILTMFVACLACMNITIRLDGRQAGIYHIPHIVVRSLTLYFAVPSVDHASLEAFCSRHMSVYVARPLY